MVFRRKKNRYQTLRQQVNTGHYRGRLASNKSTQLRRCFFKRFKFLINFHFYLIRSRLNGGVSKDIQPNINCSCTREISHFTRENVHRGSTYVTSKRLITFSVIIILFTFELMCFLLPLFNGVSGRELFTPLLGVVHGTPPIDVNTHTQTVPPPPLGVCVLF